jgi:hypothetical protein
MERSIMKSIVLLALAGFIMVIVAIAFHYHNNAFLLRNCSICKVKVSISDSVNKSNVDSAPAAAGFLLSSIAIILYFSGIINSRKSIFIDFPIAFTWLNKAPPLQS